MAECHVEERKSTAGAIEVYAGGFRRSPHRPDGTHGSAEFYQFDPRNSVSSYRSLHSTTESSKRDGIPLRGVICRDERNKWGTSGTIEAGSRCMDGGKGKVDCVGDRLISKSANQNVGLYIGASKSVCSANGSNPKFGANCSSSLFADVISHNSEDCDNRGAQVGNSFSGDISRKASKAISENTLKVGYSSGDIAGPKSSKGGDTYLASCGGAHAAKGSPYGVSASMCSLKVGGGGHGEASYAGVGISNSVSPNSETAKGVKVSSAGNAGSPACSGVRGIGNIVGAGGASGLSNNLKPGPARAITSDTQSSSFLSRGAFTPKTSGEVSVTGNSSAKGSSDSSPKNSGEIHANGKPSTTTSPRNSVEAGNSVNGSFRVSSAPRVSGSNLTVVGKGSRPTVISPTRSSSISASASNVGNLLKGNWNGNVLNGAAGHGIANKCNGKFDCANGNILNGGNLSYGLTSAPGTVSGVSSHGVAVKGTGKCDTSKNGTDATGAGNADLMSEGAFVKGALSNKDAEEVKIAGNELYKKGQFSEALSLYERAIALSPGNASYRFNKAAALSGLGRLAEAVHECEEAIKLEPLYARAHQRAASLYLRLGLVESSKRHFQAAGQSTDCGDMQRVEDVKKHISRCIEMRKAGNWNSVIRESDAAVVAGADSAPQVFGYKAEALLRLHKPDEADAILSVAQKVETSMTRLGVTPADSFLFVVQAQIDMALGRFEQAVIASDSAARSDRRNAEVSALLRKARAVCNARSLGNELFKAGKFFEACAAYGEGLESDTWNATLLCNRAACRSKLGQWEKAMEDCNAALDVRPDYTKALMRRADCHSKLERWEDALNDYEALLKVVPGDKDVARGLFDVQVAIKKSRGEEIHRMKFGGDVEEVSDSVQFQEAVKFPGLVVAQFIARWNEQCKQFSPFMNDLCKRYPFVNFIKVDVEEIPHLARTESVSIVPTFKIYKNGMKVKEILEPSKQALEYAVQHYSS